jgi:hypothetical protein
VALEPLRAVRSDWVLTPNAPLAETDSARAILAPSVAVSWRWSESVPSRQHRRPPDVGNHGSMCLPMSRAMEWTWLLGTTALLWAAFAATQPLNTINGGLGYDGQQYHAMAARVLEGGRPQAPAPYVDRVGTPALAAAISIATGRSLLDSFRGINLLASAATVILLAVWLRRHVPDAVARISVLVFFMVEPHSPLRFTFFYPVNVDPLATTWLVAGLLGVDWFLARPGVARAGAVGLLVAVGVVFREIVLVVAMAMTCAPAHVPEGETARAGGRGLIARLGAGAWLPLVTGVLAFAAVRAWSVETPSDYRLWGAVTYWLQWKTPAQMALAPLLVFGPALALPLYFARSSLRTLVERPDWMAYALIFVVGAWLGASDTERILVFTGPVVYVQIARALAISRERGSATPFLTVLVVIQLVTSRAFLPIGAESPPSILGGSASCVSSLASWLRSYETLWSFMLTREQLVALTAFEGAALLVVLTSLWWAGRRRP